ncbi:hypothetical protein HYT01_01090 [Candidatus Giovannonibacteria bacterium]|nr:hypothetical protein [Candidatus Giovannonibacteria bacterium]
MYFKTLAGAQCPRVSPLGIEDLRRTFFVPANTLVEFMGELAEEERVVVRVGEGNHSVVFTMEADNIVIMAQEDTGQQWPEDVNILSTAWN